MIEYLINEMERCIKHGCYYAALSLALELPDICAHAESGGSRTGNKKNYVAWCDACIGEVFKGYGDYQAKEHGVIPTESLPYLSGNILYGLRCNVLHQGNVDKGDDKDDDERNKNISFSLFYPDKSEHNYVFYDCSIENKNGTRDIEYAVNVVVLCDIIKLAVKKYAQENKEKVSIFQNNQVIRPYSSLC